MSFKTKIAAVALATLTLGTAAIATSGAAHAKMWHHHHHGHGWGWAGAGLAAGLIGAGIAARAYEPNVVYVDGPRCRWVRQFDNFGNYVGKAKVCRYY